MDGPDTHPFAQQRGIPDPHAVGGWDRAITRLLQGIRDREVLLVLTGPAGVGKSAVLSAVIAALARKRMRVVGLDNAYTPHWNLRQLIGHILGRPAMGPIDREMAAAFVRLSAAPAGEPAIVVVVDDAQTLTDQALEYLLGIASLARHRTPLLQFVLAGRGDFWDRGWRGELATFTARIGVRVVLDPLKDAEATEYVALRLAQAGLSPNEVATPEALAAILRNAEGLPAQIDRIFIAATAHAAGRSPLTPDVVEQAVALLGPMAGSPDPPMPSREAAARPARVAPPPAVPLPEGAPVNIAVASVPVPGAMIALRPAPPIRRRVLAPPMLDLGEIARLHREYLAVASAERRRRRIRVAAVVATAASLGVVGLAWLGTRPASQASLVIAESWWTAHAPFAATDNRAAVNPSAPAGIAGATDAALASQAPAAPDDDVPLRLNDVTDDTAPAATQVPTAAALAPSTQAMAAIAHSVTGPDAVRGGVAGDQPPAIAAAPASTAIAHPTAGAATDAMGVAPVAGKVPTMATPSRDAAASTPDLDMSVAGQSVPAGLYAASTPGSGATAARAVPAAPPATSTALPAVEMHTRAASSTPTPATGTQSGSAATGTPPAPAEVALAAAPTLPAAEMRAGAAASAPAPATETMPGATATAAPGSTATGAPAAPAEVAPSAVAPTLPAAEVRAGSAPSVPASGVDAGQGRAPTPGPPSGREGLAVPAQPASPPAQTVLQDVPKPAGSPTAGAPSSATIVEAAARPPAAGSPGAAAAQPPVPPTLARPAPAVALSPQMVALLLRRGGALLEDGDVSGARLYYERAAEAGSGPGASGAGRTYDPAFLASIDARGLQGDAVRAIDWYRKAIALGDQGAAEPLRTLIARTGQ